MPIPEKYMASFEQQAYYHIICKSLPKQRLFLNDENKRYFLERYYYYLGGYVNTFCYILLDTHCHFLVQVRPHDEILASLQCADTKKITLVQKKFISKDPSVSIDILIERQFNSFFVSYTRSFNNFFKLKGHLFDSPFRRISVKDETHMSQLVVYIHANAVHHKLVNSVSEYAWSSYSDIIYDKASKVAKEKVINLFGDVSRFVSIHKTQTDYYYKFDE